MILRIGNKKKTKGFTLFEVMIAALVLLLGVVLIHETFFSSLDLHNYYVNYLNLSSWADEKIWQAQDDLEHLGPGADILRIGKFRDRNRTFNWNLSFNLIDDEADMYSMYEINLEITWQEGKRQVKVSRSAYAIYDATNI